MKNRLAEKTGLAVCQNCSQGWIRLVLKGENTHRERRGGADKSRKNAYRLSCPDFDFLKTEHRPTTNSLSVYLVHTFNPDLGQITDQQLLKSVTNITNGILLRNCGMQGISAG